jgi:hypothetical protein
MEPVFSVRYELCVYVKYGLIRFKTGRAVAQAVSRRPRTTEERIRSEVSPCKICGGQSGTGTFPPPPPEYFGFS